MTAAQALEQKIRNAIPLSAAMQFTIEVLNQDEIQVSAPLEPNINVHGTGFAGSIYSAAILTGWALCTHVMDVLELDGDLVVAKADISYLAPITAALECRCQVNAKQRDSFARGLLESGKGKLLLEVEVGDRPHAVVQATYIAVRR